jgi:hypothetical protein
MWLDIVWMENGKFATFGQVATVDVKNLNHIDFVLDQ